MSCFFAFLCHAQATGIYDLLTFGAVGDGVTLDTKPLQAAIDKCSASGGGTVLVAGGNFVTGTLYLKNDVTLRVDSGATISGSANIADYTTDTDHTMYKEPYMNPLPDLCARRKKYCHRRSRHD